MSPAAPDTSFMTLGSSQAAAPGYSVLLAQAKPTVPAPGDPNWATYWKEKDPQGWSLVWDSQVPQKRTFNDNLKSGQPVYFSFDTKDSQAEYKNYLTPMSEEQKANARKALQELSNATGVKFVERSGVKGGLVLAQADLSSGTDKFSTMGQHQGAELTVLDAKGNKTTQYQQTIMVNKWEYGGKTLAPGTSGFETLLHELGHAAGLDDAKEDLAKKYPDLNDTKFTLMSYDDAEGRNRQTFGELDKRAFEILYPRDQRPATPPVVTVAVPRTQMSAAATPLGGGAFDAEYYDEELSDLEVAETQSAVPPPPDGNREPSGATGESMSESTANEDQEVVVGVEEGPILSQERRPASTDFTLGPVQAPVSAASALWLGPFGQSPSLTAGPAMSASGGAFSDILPGADAMRHLLAQG